jgi:hypothetical protein
MFRSDLPRQYSLGYFARKYNLDRAAARLVLATSKNRGEANRRGRSLRRRSLPMATI